MREWVHERRYARYFVPQLPAKWLDSFNEQLHADCLFLEAMGLIDYSMLVGIHFRDAKKSPNLLKSLGNKFMVQVRVAHHNHTPHHRPRKGMGC
jgi:1-phosphatidylinositol-4-phosphate 5-kinase